MRDQVVCVLAQGIARAVGQHHERNRSAARQPTANAIRWSGQQLVRQEFRRGDQVRETRANRL